jgi:hypothetical protein
MKFPNTIHVFDTEILAVEKQTDQMLVLPDMANSGLASFALFPFSRNRINHRKGREKTFLSSMSHIRKDRSRRPCQLPEIRNRKSGRGKIKKGRCFTLYEVSQQGKRESCTLHDALSKWLHNTIVFFFF